MGIVYWINRQITSRLSVNKQIIQEVLNRRESFEKFHKYK